MVTTDRYYCGAVIYDISAANFEKVFKIVGFPYPVTTMDYWSVNLFNEHFAWVGELRELGADD